MSIGSNKPPPSYSECSRPCCYKSPQTLPHYSCSQNWLKIPERIENRVISFTVSHSTHFNPLSPPTPPSAVLNPTTSFSPFLFHPITPHRPSVTWLLKYANSSIVIAVRLFGTVKLWNCLGVTAQKSKFFGC